MKIFVSHASEQAEIASGIALSLRGDGHDVFVDRSALPPGDTYDDQIREAIASSDLVVFLVSPEAMAPGRYTLTELELIEAKWAHPAGHVLPVVVRPTDLRTVSSYLKAVTLLEPRGNVAAAVAAAVARTTGSTWRRVVRRSAVPLAVAGIAVLGLASWWLHRTWQDRQSVSTLLASARAQAESGNFSSAWELGARASAVRPHDDAVVATREQLAMSWLDHAKVTVGEGSFAGIVERVEEVLVACAASAAPVRAADCRAHVGWADFLRSREGREGGNPVAQYRQALDRDPRNVYAHAMWGFEILRTGGPLAAAYDHFARALASGRERSYVRRLQLAGLLWRRDERAEEELVRVVDQLRQQHERASDAVLDEYRWRLWNVYYARLVNGQELESFLAAVPASDHLATFVAAFPPDDIPPDKRTVYQFMLGTLQEHAGDPRALETFRSLHATLARQGALASGGRLPDRTEAALRRLTPGGGRSPGR